LWRLTVFPKKVNILLLNGLNSAWRLASDRGRWSHLVETATLHFVACPQWWWWL